MSTMLTLLRHFWRSLLFAGTVIGVLAIPSDLEKHGELTAPYRRLLGWADQTAALWILVAICGSWILWIEARPYILRLRKPNRSIVALPQVYWESKFVESPNGLKLENVHAVTVSIIVTNARDDKKTIRNLRSYFSMVDGPRALRERDSGALSIDLRHGEYAFIEIGRFLYTKLIGSPSFHNSYTATENDMLQIQHNLLHGQMLFEVLTDKSGPNIAQIYGMEKTDFPFFVTFAGDDVESTVLECRMDLQKLPDLEAAFQTTLR